MYANNRAGTATKAVFRTAGGSVYLYSHPFLTGQLGSGATTGSPIGGFTSMNTVDISAALRLNDTYFNATPLQDNALMEVMVDGSTLTITNHVMAGRATLQVVPGTGLVRDGDLPAIAAFIASSKDNVGGALIRKRFTSSGTMTRIYYGVSFANFPHDVDTGNAVPVYAMTMLYGGWIEGISASANDDKLLWAVGNIQGLKGSFEAFSIAGVGKVDVGGADAAGQNTSIDDTSMSAGAAVTDVATAAGADGVISLGLGAAGTPA